MSFTLVAQLDDLKGEEPLVVDINGQSIALYRLNGDVFATDNICTHQYALLSEGYIDGDCIECPLHQACFDIRTGKVVSGPAERPLKVYRVRMDGTDILAEI